MDITVQRIEALVAETGITMRDLAETVGCSKSAIQRYMTGQRDMPTSIVNGFAKAFNVHPAYLFGWVDDRHFPVEEKKPGTMTEAELSENKRALMQLIEECPEDQAARLLQILQLFLHSEQQGN